MSPPSWIVFVFASICLFPNDVLSQQFNCTSEGRFGVPSECGEYVDCVLNPKTGDMEQRKGSCGKGGYHPKIKKCVDLKKLKGCKARRARLDNLRVDLNYLCTGGADFVCSDCNTLIYCIKGNAYAQSCVNGDVCQVREAFGGAVCHPDPIETCSCQNSNEFKGDPYSENTFFFCDIYALPTFYKCSEEMVFDQTIKQCVSTKGLPPCERIGAFADKDDCRNYYTCIQSERGWVQKLITCPGLTMFSELNSRCEDPCNWFKGEFTCKGEGRFKDLTDCRSFYECVDLVSSFRQTKRRCPLEFHWKQFQGENTGSCVMKEDSYCKPLTPTTCDVPPDWCSFDMEEDSGPQSFEETIVVDLDQIDWVPDPFPEEVMGYVDPVAEFVDEGTNYTLVAVDYPYSVGEGEGSIDEPVGDFSETVLETSEPVIEAGYVESTYVDTNSSLITENTTDVSDYYTEMNTGSDNEENSTSIYDTDENILDQGSGDGIFENTTDLTETSTIIDDLFTDQNSTDISDQVTDYETSSDSISGEIFNENDVPSAARNMNDQNELSERKRSGVLFFDKRLK